VSTFGPIAGGYSGTVSVPTATASATVTVTFTLGAPSGVPQVQSDKRVPSAIGATGITPVGYVTVIASANAGFGHAPSITVTGPGSIVPNLSYYAALYDPTATAGWALLGPTTTNGTTTFTFDGSATPPLNLTANRTYAFALFGVPQPLASPTPTAVPRPQGSPSVTPTSLQITALSDTPTVQVTETGYSGAFTADTSACAGVLRGAMTAPTVFTITPIGAGSCTVGFTDTFKQMVALPVTVTASTITVH
jgi:hypothetical protein